MIQTAYIEYIEENEYVDPYSIVLGSEDGTYGVKREDGEVIVSNGQSVTKISTGIYEHDFEVESGYNYTVSWKIKSSSSADFKYYTEIVGPFEETQDAIRAVADYKGNFKTGQAGMLFLQITDFDGNAINADSILVKIKDQNGDIILTKTPDQIKTGYYIYEWLVGSDVETGEYTVLWEYDLGTETMTEVQSINVVETGDGSKFSGGRLYMMRVALENFLSSSQRVPVYYEQAKPSSDNQTFRFTFPRWNQTTGCKIYKNGKIVTSGLEINYFKGEIVFDYPLLPEETVHADYNFRWFEDEQLNAYIINGINMYNHTTPFTGYNYENIPDGSITGVLYKATADALRQQIADLMFQQPQIVFGQNGDGNAADAAAKIRSDLESLKKNFEGDWKYIFEQKKLGRYPSIWVSIPMNFTLPGGRSRWFRMMFGLR